MVTHVPPHTHTHTHMYIHHMHTTPTSTRMHVHTHTHRKVCKIVDSLRDCAYVYNRVHLSCTEVFVGLGASGEIETEECCGQFYVFFPHGASTVLNVTKAMD